MKTDNFLGLQGTPLLYPQQYIKNKFKIQQEIQIHSVDSQLKSSPPSTSGLNTPPLIQEKALLRALVDESQNFGQVLRLAYMSGNGEVHIDEQSLYFLQKYSTFQISFIGVMGPKQSGKSFIIDTVLNLSCSQGNQFTTVYGNSREKGIYLWTIPFSSNNRLKIFLLQCSGLALDEGDQQRQDEIFIDLMMILSSSLVILSAPNSLQARKKRKNPIFQKQNNILNPVQATFISQLSKSSKRILNDSIVTSKADEYWPKTVYYLNHTRNKQPDRTIQCLFQNVNSLFISDPLLFDEQSKQQLLLSFNNDMNSINQVFIRQISQMFAEIIQRISTKQYMNLKFTGNICCKLLINTIKYLNKKPKIKINKVFNSILKELYLSSFTYHKELYDDYLKQFFSDETPLPYDNLIDAFKTASESTLTSFNQIIINQQTHDEYQNKLLSYIEEKEVLIIQINSKKTKNILKDKVKNLQTLKNYDLASVKEFIKTLNSIEQELDHNRSYMIADKLLRYTKNLQKRYIQQKQQYERQALKRLREQIDNGQQQFIQTRDNNQKNKRINRQNQKQYKRLLKEIADHQGSVRRLKKQVQNQKKYQKEYIVNKESKKQQAQNLLQILREYEQKVRENNKNKEQINKQYEYHPEVLSLQKKIEERQRQIKQLERMESRMEFRSNNTSVIRSAIQKPGQKTTIKRLSKQK